MPETGLHFANPWLLLLLLVPLAVWLWLRLTSPREHSARYRIYADRHLLPFLLGSQEMSKHQQWRRFLGWSVLWSLLVVGIAGPRWDFHDVQLFRPGNDLVIMLDLSTSMDATDVNPSRLTRARQEIQDLIEHNRHARIGLIGFATMAHVIAPLTEDAGSLRALLPALSTDLVELRGSRLDEALVRGEQMLSGQPANSSRHLLLITDGDFGDDKLEEPVTRLAHEGIHLHILGIGTPEGALVPGDNGAPLRLRDGNTVTSRLEEDVLKKLAAAGDGIYQRAGYRDDDTRSLLEVINKLSHSEVVANQMTRIWNERYFLLVALGMLLILPMYRRLPRAALKQETQ